MSAIILGALTAVVLFAWLVAVLAAQDGLEPRDWLAAAGGMIGIAAPVGITFLITHWSERKNDQRARADIVETAGKMSDLIAAWRGDWFSEQPQLDRDYISGSWARFRVDLDRLIYTSNRLTSESYAQYGRKRGIELAIDRLNSEIEGRPNAFSPLAFWFDNGDHLEKIDAWLHHYRQLHSTSSMDADA